MVTYQNRSTKCLIFDVLNVNGTLVAQTIQLLAQYNNYIRGTLTRAALYHKYNLLIFKSDKRRYNKAN